MRSFVLALLLAAGCSPAESTPTTASEGLYTHDDPGRRLQAVHHVHDYQAMRELRVDGEGARRVLLRRLEIDDVPSYLVLDDATLRTSVIAASEIDGETRTATDEEAASFRYTAMLQQTRNAVLCHLDDASQAGLQFAVTIDMCQSRREWDGALYERLVSWSDQLDEPIKVGVALTGLWANRHTDELAQLIAWKREGKLDITWINHSYRHQLSQDADGHYHFLTSSDVDLEAGVLHLEQLLIEQGQVPSPLFRFPGLAHDQRTLAELNDLSLFALDANGWLAKGEPLADGSVVLLHGNGNEPPGIQKFFSWAEAHGDEVTAGSAQLVDPVDTLPRMSSTVSACAP